MIYERDKTNPSTILNVASAYSLYAIHPWIYYIIYYMRVVLSDWIKYKLTRNDRSGDIFNAITYARMSVSLEKSDFSLYYLAYLLMSTDRKSEEAKLAMYTAIDIAV